MLRIIKKDIYQSRYLIILYSLFVLLYMIFMTKFEGNIKLAGLIVLMVPLGVSIKNEIYEQKNKGYNLLKKLPLKPYKIVVSKFLTTLLLSLYSILFVFIISSILSGKLVFEIIESTTCSVLVGSLVVGIFYIIAYRFGAEKANAFIIISLGVLMVLGQVMFLFVRNSNIKRIIITIENLFRNVKGYNFIIGCIVLYLLTMILSIRIFRTSKVI